MRLALAALLAVGLAATVAAQTPSTPEARIVVQSSRRDWIDVAAWTPDSRFLFTANGKSRELLLWDIEQQVIVDRVALPGHPGELDGETQYHSMQMDAAGTTLRIEGQTWTNAMQPVGLTFIVDVASRAVRLQSQLQPKPTGSAAKVDNRKRAIWFSANMKAYDPKETPAIRAENAALLPALPSAPNGRWRILREYPHFVLEAADGQQRHFFQPISKRSIADGQVSPNGQTLAISLYDGTTLVVELLDLLSGSLKSRFTLPRTAKFIDWLDDDHFLVKPWSDADDSLQRGAASGLQIVESREGTVTGKLPWACFPTVIDDAKLISIGQEDCRKTGWDPNKLRTRFLRLQDGDWAPLETTIPQRVLDKSTLLGLGVSRRSSKVAVLLFTISEQRQAYVLDPVRGDAVRLRLPPMTQAKPTSHYHAAGFAPDGGTLWVASEGEILEWPLAGTPKTIASAQPRRIATSVQSPVSVESNGEQLLVAGEDGRVTLVDRGAATPRLALEFSPRIKAAGLLPGRPIIWAAALEGLRLWDSRSGAVILTTYFLGDGFVSVTPDGRYDTNLGPDSRAFRWLISDRPFDSLAPQTLMRDFYTPQLSQRLINCMAAGNCTSVLKPLPALASLNRLLPVILVTKIDSVTPGWMLLSLEIDQTHDAAKGQSSGVFGLKVLLNNRQVLSLPEAAETQAHDLEKWRRASRLSADGAAGTLFLKVPVALPSDGLPVKISAYSFNSDRVKSDTVQIIFDPPPAPRRPRRAFVLTIGVNDYGERRLRLNFAVPDALLIAERLASMPGYEVRRASLTTTATRTVTRDHVLLALSLLGGRDVEGARARLRMAGHDVSQLDEVSPDDVVIISFSGHGAVDGFGNFALLPSDARWPLSAPQPEGASVISMDDLTYWLRSINPRDIALIIDACHSGAAVATPDFKPGPMGDPGLGQLAFDKGIRILAATQADDVALENASLAQGYLTAALGEGLSAEGGPADLDRDGRVGLDEWLRYAVKRLPSLEEEVRRGGGIDVARGVRLIMRRTETAPARAQLPSLFDFNAAPSTVILRGRQ
ncbi:caspase family protein [Sandarakinorhabdus oryzae]|uniref:caspase family protein n=1 Tax=Sandarakinorhabdus oryzae TaxID=2675220 RepID=UPI0018CC0ACB|nr:caspase family protein [Sandarakinorhabdus oryzae]